MLFKISKSDSKNRDVFPNVLHWGQWFIEYDNQFEPIIEDNKFILGKFKSKDNKYQRVFKEINNNIEFNNLFTITNMPINRFGSVLVSQNKFDSYRRSFHI